MTARISRFHPEYRHSGFAVATRTPRLSWQIVADAPGLVQTAYELRVERARETVHTGWTDSAEQILIDWPFRPIESRERVTISVRARLSNNYPTDWSEPLHIEGALYDDADWSTAFACVSQVAPAEGVRRGYLMRAEFDLPDGVERLRAYASAHGIYRLELDGDRVGDDELAPGWTSYRHRLRFQTLDLDHARTAGRHALGAELSDGWYRGRIGFHGGIWDNYGTDLALLVQLEATLDTGEVTSVPLRWTVSDKGPVVAASLYDGENYDARLVPPGWSRPGFDDTSWSAVESIPISAFPGRLEPAIANPVRVTEILPVVAHSRRPDGRIRLDFGQNISGKLRIRAAAPAGHTVVLHHAEVLEDDELAIRPLRSAPSVDRYVFSGDGVEEWTPRFTVHGFRYAELENWPGDFDPRAVEALVVHTDMERTGWFSSSHALVDQLHENTRWSMRDNFVDLPTDCPQRDERLGWTGDIQVFAPAAMTLYDSSGTLATWLRDLAAEQGDDGHVPNFVPWIECGFPNPSAAAWGDAAVVVPWTMYLRRGDKGILSEQLPSMIRWVEHFASKTDERGVIADGMQLGDWLDPIAPPENPGAARTDRYLVATAYLARSAELLRRAAEVLEQDEVAARAAEIANRTRQGYQKIYLGEGDGFDTPTAHALSICFELLDGDDARTRTGARLAQLVAEGGHRIQTGFVGTPLICDALAMTGQLDAAYRLLDERECPSWLYPVSMGATTIWERWDSMLPDGTVNPGEMTSFNHYALGAVVDFLYRTVAGIDPVDPGYRRFRIAPRPGALFDRAAARVTTPYGDARVDWQQTETSWIVEAEVPVGTTAVLIWPDQHEQSLGSGIHHLEYAR